MGDVEQLITDEKQYKNTHKVKGKSTVTDSIYSDAIKQAMFSPRAQATKAIKAT